MNVKFLLLIFISFLSLSLKANVLNKAIKLFPDTTVSIVDRSTALVIIEEGKRLFYEGKVRDALTQFRAAGLKDPNSWRPIYWVGECHYSMHNFGFALKYGHDAIKQNSIDVDKEVYFLLGNSYHHLGNLDSAVINYQLALTFLTPNRSKDLNVSWKIEQCNFAKNLISSGVLSKRVHMNGEINTGFNEYAPVLSKDGKTIYFTSRRNNTKGSRMNPDDQEYFEDVYRAVWNESVGKWDSITNEVDRINTDGFDSFSYLSEDGLTALMTVNTENTDNKKRTKVSDIFELNFTNKGKWSTPKMIINPTINTGYFDGSPTMTADGNTMYFVSDRNGAKKMTDIYVVHKTGKTWGEAVAISDSINTSGTETTPYITPDGKYLFFSSDGHLGMGGLDIFVSENLGNNWSAPKNLGVMVNTVNNDTHFKYYQELQKAVMAGFEIIGQKSSVDMYEIDMTGYVFPVFF